MGIMEKEMLIDHSSLNYRTVSGSAGENEEEYDCCSWNWIRGVINRHSVVSASYACSIRIELVRKIIKMLLTMPMFFLLEKLNEKPVKLTFKLT